MRKPSEIFEVGTKVFKLSGKPFKSGFVVNTVKGVVEHPNKIDPETNTGVPAYTFFEDDSIVEASACTPEKPIKVKITITPLEYENDKWIEQ